LPESAEAQVLVADEDMLRAHLYALLAHLLSGPPDGATLARLRVLEGDDSPIGNAFAALAAAAAAAAPETLEREFFDLFIGMAGGEVMPYASLYLTGFLYEKPLAELRADLAVLGIERAEGVPEPEDHVAALFEVMGGLITGTFGEPAALATQKRFFARHLAPWASRFFDDLEKAEAARFYGPVARLGRLFLGVEQDAFAMV